MDRADAVASQASQEVAEFKDYVLACSRLEVVRTCAANIIGREKNHGIANVTMVLQFLHDRASLACLFVEDDWNQAQLAYEACDGLTDGSIMAVDDEHLSTGNRW